MKVEKKVAPMIKKIENKLSVRSKLFIGLLLGALAIKGGLSIHSHNDITASSVMVTNMAGNSGGTGVIIESSDSKSVVITNSHVCHVVEKGGVIQGRNGTFMVDSYAHSKMHDLCKITVQGNLGVSTKIASRAPISYYEKASISGHPALMPNVISSGHFSGRQIITIMTGLRPCTEDDMKDTVGALICMLAGGMPILKQYDSVLVTATIMPGSSGSGVYNDKDELTGLAFAGSQGFGYAWTVPYEYLREFIDSEMNSLESIRPTNTVEFVSSSASSRDTSPDFAVGMKMLREACAKEEREQLKEICVAVKESLLYTK